MPLEIRYSPEAAAQLAEMKAKAEKNPNGADAAAYAAVAKIIRDVIANPDLCLLKDHMLRGSLAGVCRAKMGRLRIFYLASSQRQRAIILMVGYRKDGDKRDAYEEALRLMKRGTFDSHFQELGVKKPS